MSRDLVYCEKCREYVSYMRNWSLGSNCCDDCVKTPTVDTPLASPQVTDILANLANRVHSLEQQLSDTQANVEKLAEELANTKHRVSKHAAMFGIVEERVGMLTDDIITLYERSQVLNAINKFYEEGNR
jgi:septal ring factor EnvC (AmiA/AmiB activator)